MSSLVYSEILKQINNPKAVFLFVSKHGKTKIIDNSLFMLNLDTKIEDLSGVGGKTIPRLHRLGIKTVRDLLWHFPSRYEDFSQLTPIENISEKGQSVSIRSVIRKIDVMRARHRRMTIVNAVVEDDTGTLRVTWFNQPYIADHLPVGAHLSLSGKVSEDKKGLYLSNPQYERLSTNDSAHSIHELKHTGRLVPIYPETQGITSKYLRFLVKPLLDYFKEIPDPLPTNIMEINAFPNVKEALNSIHFPNDIEHTDRAKARFAFEELLMLQLRTLIDRTKMQTLKAPAIKFDKELIASFVKNLPFALTDDQRVATYEVLKDIEHLYPMNRLLNGDVGAGKTVVALIGAYQVANQGLQTVIMAPTEILALQHYMTTTELLSKANGKNEKIKSMVTLRVGLLTGSQAKQWPIDEITEEKITKKLMHQKIAQGQIDIIIGTHAVISKEVEFKNLGFVVIDEQHRFGIAQRAKLVGRGSIQNERGQMQAQDTQTNADFKIGTQTSSENVDLLYKDLTYKVRGAVFAVKDLLGLGHKESAYRNALIVEFKKRDIPFVSEKSINVEYDGEKIGAYKPDYIIDNKIILELKSLSFKAWKGKEQTWKYLRATKYKLALLVNFSTSTVYIDRIVFDIARNGIEVSDSHRLQSPRKSGLVPHLLSMTATPIPRTLALTIYGDLDVSLIKQKPKGRKSIITKVISERGRIKTYKFIDQQIQQGRQVFVICPRIELSKTEEDASFAKASEGKPISQAKLVWAEVKAVEEEFKKLSLNTFKHRRVAMLHGKMPQKEKETIMNDFRDHKYDIVVSTSVIEVGVDVANATIMMIESAERFGLAQLHQFRGRVGRGEHQSYCLLFTSCEDRGVSRRLKAMERTNDGFELAQMDLTLRGPGEFAGVKQSGIPDLTMSSLNDLDLIKKTRTQAQKILQTDPTLKNHLLLKAQLEKMQRIIHFE